ncbi:class I SAM-dependent methyltransferase [Phormidium tenue FACHB-886]|nr:class I SAM-dependent methyltransferase [Phormidium tenue FACHB-886]
MTSPTSEELERLREHFNYGPYPRIPIEESPKEAYERLYCHNFVTPYYLHHRRVPNLQGKIILDAGCGSGYKSLILAEANPGAKIVGIDLSEKSVELAQQRLKFHGFANTEFHAIAIEELPKLGLMFDYINCDEVLYLLPDPLAGLQALAAVLKPDGLLRTNLHNFHQRANFYRAQSLFQLMGVAEVGLGEFAEQAVVETMDSLHEFVALKEQTWQGRFRDSNRPELISELIGANHLLVGDKGFTIPDLFALLEGANLEFVSMVNWRHWDLTDLFKDAENLPALWEMGLATASVQDRLYLYQLLHPVHRLLDFWCAHPGESGAAVEEWSEADWQTATVHLHPQLKVDRLKQDLIDCFRSGQPFEISKLVPLPALTPVFLNASTAACLLPLWESAQPIAAIVARYQQIHPVDPATLEPIDEAQAFEQVKDLLNRLDAFLYVLLERA